MIKRLPLLFLFAIVVSSIHAQIKLGGFIGVHSSNVIEANNTANWLTTVKPFYSGKSGIQIGIMGDIPIGQKGFYLQPGIFYSAQGRQFNKSYDTLNMIPNTEYPVYQNTVLKINYIEVPLNIAYKKFLSRSHKSSFFLSIGPYIAFMYSSQMVNQSLSVLNDSLFKYNNGTDDLPIGNGANKYKTTDIGINARAGFEFGNVILSAYGSRGLTNFFSPQDYQGTYHHQLIGASLGIWLAKTAATAARKPVKVAPVDTDKDGVPDNVDLCPTVPGFAKYNGCPIPDTDGDGINDEEDSCKTVAGTAKYHGCPIPDTDGDGINDEEDSCKTVAGTAKYHGCPIPDTDGDGINDEEDKCPTIPGIKENNGCPEIKKEIREKVNYVAHNILFKTASDKLTAGSYARLNELADVLSKHNELKLAIDGYTDSIGTVEDNLALSQKRAGAVKNYLIAKGIAENRITATGHGKEQPIADNGTEKGRSANRRVELNLSSAEQ